MSRKICMIVQNPMVKGGIAAVVNGYKHSDLERDYEIIYIESYIDGGKVRKICKAMLGYCSFIKVIIVDKPDIVHIHTSFGPSFYRKILFVILAKLAHKPIINHIHGSEFGKFYLNASKNKKKLVQFIWGMCDKFILLSDEWKDIFSVVLPQVKMVVIENYSKIADFVENKSNNNQILFLGAINKMKGCYDIVDVIKIVKLKLPDIRMVIAGDGDIEKIKEKALKNGVEDNIVLPGWIRMDEKEKYLEKSDIFYLPSYTEGMPMSILDAMGYGLPIVSTKVGGIPQIINEGINGYLLEPGDIEGMAVALIRLITDDEIRDRMRRSSYLLAKEKYSLEIHIKKISELYKEYIE